MALLLAGIVGPVRDAQSHCQIPCGIYDDAARIAHLREDAATIAKAVTMINDLAGKNDAQSLNQLTRWVFNKEEHASDIITVVSEYFLAQRIKPVAEGGDEYAAYQARLVEHHAVIVAAMKTKQTVDEAAVTALNNAIDAIAKYYDHDH